MSVAVPYEAGDAMTCAQVRAFDAHAIEVLGVPGIVLMENAGRSAAEIVYAELRDPKHEAVIVLCGSGNNGGDGFVVARHLRNAGVGVSVVLAMLRERCGGDAAVNLGIYERLGGAVVHASIPEGFTRASEAVGRSAIIVDALLGTGSSGPPRGTIGELLRVANASPHGRRIAIDIPTGLMRIPAIKRAVLSGGRDGDVCCRKGGISIGGARSVLGRVRWSASVCRRRVRVWPRRHDFFRTRLDS